MNTKVCVRMCVCFEKIKCRKTFSYLGILKKEVSNKENNLIVCFKEALENTSNLYKNNTV